MSKITSSDALDLITLSKAENKIGDVKTSMLTLAQFQSEHLGVWMLMDGASCVGTAYEALTGKTVVPDMMTNGTFPRQAKTGRELGSYEADEVKAHGHSFAMRGNNGGTGPVGYPYTAGTDASTGNTDATGGAETRPKNTAMNFFIKVGY